MTIASTAAVSETATEVESILFASDTYIETLLALAEWARACLYGSAPGGVQ